jgi:hypothetical protein
LFYHVEGRNQVLCLLTISMIQIHQSFGLQFFRQALRVSQA